MPAHPHNYPSDITREAFEIIRGDLEAARKRTRPRQMELYDVFCAILYLTKSGCQWRMLPSDFPKRGIVRYYYDVWSAPRKEGGTLLARVLKKIDRVAPQRRVAPGQDTLRDCGRAKRAKRGHGPGEGV